MDLSILPRDFSCSSPTQLRFFKNATIREICASYNKYRTQKSNPRVKDSIESTSKLLSILEEKGLVYSFYDGATSWLCYDVIDDTKKDTTHMHVTLQRSTSPVELKSNLDLPADAKTDDLAPPELTDFSETVDQKDFTKIIVTTDEEAGDDVLLTPELKQSQPLLWQLKVAAKYTNIIRSAVKRQLDFNLEIADVEDLVSQRRCFYTGVEFDAEHVLTFDRVDRTKGYVKGNVVACTTQANALKNSLFEMTDGVFKDIASLKRFVDIIYIGMSKEKDVLSDLLLFK